jgi:hypothetical protein
MTEAPALELRHVRLAESVILRPAQLGPTPEGTVEEGVFVALDDSPPVRTVLAVVEGGRRRALEVAWVVEVAERDEAKGFYGRWLADEALERAARVGTEHLEDGTPVVQPVVYDNSAVLDVSDTSMAMPAPVIVMDDDNGAGDDEDDERHEAREADADESAEPTVDYDEHPYVGDTVSYARPAEPEADTGDYAAPASSTDDTLDYPAPGPAPGPAPKQAVGETVSYADYRHPDDATGSVEPTAASEGAEASDGDESGESTDSGESAESVDAGDSAESGDAAAPAKGGRKKRGRKRR